MHVVNRFQSMQLCKHIRCLATSSDPQLFGVFQYSGSSAILHGDLLATLTSNDVITSDDDSAQTILMPGFHMALSADSSLDNSVRSLTTLRPIT
jgi:hypothetical protein